LLQYNGFILSIFHYAKPIKINIIIATSYNYISDIVQDIFVGSKDTLKFLSVKLDFMYYFNNSTSDLTCIIFLYTMGWVSTFFSYFVWFHDILSVMLEIFFYCISTCVCLSNVMARNFDHIINSKLLIVLSLK